MKEQATASGPLLSPHRLDSVHLKKTHTSMPVLVTNSIKIWLLIQSTVSVGLMRLGWGPLRGAVSSQKDPQGSETEMRELLAGMKEQSVFPMRRH